MLLEKGQTSPLTEKSVQEGPKEFYIGAAWAGDVDLDLMVVPVNGKQSIESEVCYYSNLESFSGAIKHSGDALTGDDDEGDDESVVIKTEGLPANVSALVVGVVAYNVKDMSEASDTKLTIRDGGSLESPSLYEMPMADDDTEGETILVGCALKRDGDSKWTATSIAEFRTDFPHGIEAIRGFSKIAPSYV